MSASTLNFKIDLSYTNANVSESDFPSQPTSAFAKKRNEIVDKCRKNLALNNTLRKGVTYDRDAIYTLPIQEQQRKTGILEKLSANGDNEWIPVLVILSDTAICFSPVDSLEVADCIPTNEVMDVCLFDDSVEINLKPFESGPAWSCLFNNLTRLTGSKDFDAMERFPFAVYTVEKGYNGNRTYFLRAKSEEERLGWIEIIADIACHLYRAEVKGRSKIRQVRFIGRRAYEADLTQQFLASLIFCNFIVNCVDAQFQPTEGTMLRQLLDILDILFTALFCLELAVNLFLHWFWPFFNGPNWYWNIFDATGVIQCSGYAHFRSFSICPPTRTRPSPSAPFLTYQLQHSHLPSHLLPNHITNPAVVLFSVVTLLLTQSGVANILRTIRAFRVIRVFRRLRTLNLLMLAFYQAAAPVLTSIFVLILVLAMFDILAVDLFSGIDSDLFRDFIGAGFTMFQVVNRGSPAHGAAHCWRRGIRALGVGFAVPPPGGRARGQGLPFWRPKASD